MWMIWQQIKKLDKLVHDLLSKPFLCRAPELIYGPVLYALVMYVCNSKIQTSIIIVPADVLAPSGHQQGR